MWVEEGRKTRAGGGVGGQVGEVTGTRLGCNWDLDQRGSQGGKERGLM